MGLRCGASFALGTILLVLASIPETSLGSKNIVGGSVHWRFGFNYTDWAIKTAPFHTNDSLVFMYDPPNSTSFPHSVYLLKNLRSFLACDLKKAKLVGNPIQGVGQGFEFVLKNRKPHYFACGERAGFHCNVGLMKFSVLPIRPCHG